MPEGRFTSIVLDYGPKVLATAAIVNMFSYMQVNQWIGGSASSGMIHEGRYYVGSGPSNPMNAEVSPEIWWMNLVHGYSLWLMLALVVIPSGLLILYGAYRYFVLQDLSVNQSVENIPHPNEIAPPAPTEIS